MQLYFEGPTLENLNVGINVAHGYPVAREDEVILKVYVEEDEFILKSDKDNFYSIPRRVITRTEIQGLTTISYEEAVPHLRLSAKDYKEEITGIIDVNRDFSDPTLTPPGNADGYDVYWPVAKFEGFLENLRIVDYKTEPKWWLKLVETLSLQLVPDMSEELRAKTGVIDQVFEKYLKFNTLGVFVKTEVLTNFEGVRDFYNIFDNVKGAAKTYLVSAQDIAVLSTILTESDDGTQVSVTNKIKWTTIHDIPLRMANDLLFMNRSGDLELREVEVTDPINEIGAAYDQVGVKLNFLAEIDGALNPDAIKSSYNIGFGPLIDSNQFPFGFMPDEGVLTQLEIEVLLSEGIVESDLGMDTQSVNYLITTENATIFQWNNEEGIGTTFEDSGGFGNDGIVILNPPGAIFVYELNDTLFTDNTPNNNDGSLQALPPVPPPFQDSIFWFDSQLTGSGLTVVDSSISTNNGTIESLPVPHPYENAIFYYEPDATGTGITLEDSGPDTNDGEITLYTDFDSNIPFDYYYNFTPTIEYNDQTGNSNHLYDFGVPMVFVPGILNTNAIDVPNNGALLFYNSATASLANAGFTLLFVLKRDSAGTGGSIVLRKWSNNAAYDTIDVSINQNRIVVTLMGTPAGLGQELRIETDDGIPEDVWVGVGVIMDITNDTAHIIVNQTEFSYTEPNIPFTSFSGTINNNTNRWFIGNRITYSTLTSQHEVETNTPYKGLISRIAKVNQVLDVQLVKNMFDNMGLRD
jgi:hypothetical protein